jgi:predicted ABC-type sugar transport system permease subunit
MPQPNEVICDLFVPIVVVIGLAAVVICQFIFNRNEF